MAEGRVVTLMAKMRCGKWAPGSRAYRTVRTCRIGCGAYARRATLIVESTMEPGERRYAGWLSPARSGSRPDVMASTKEECMDLLTKLTVRFHRQLCSEISGRR